MNADNTNENSTRGGTMASQSFDEKDPRWLNCFVSSTLLWMSDNDHKTGTVKDIVDKFQSLSDKVPRLDSDLGPSVAPSALGLCGPLQWRIGAVSDFRGINLPAAGERLTRWEISKPREVFRNGIISLAERLSRDNVEYNVSDIVDLKDQFADLRRYVRNGKPSLFISTSRTIKNPSGGPPLHVVPDKPEDVVKRYEYEIFVHGGIDAKASGEFGSNFSRKDEQEITLAGGVRREFIRSVRKYRGEKGIKAIPKVWENPYFNPSANGTGVTFNIGQLPDVVEGASEAKKRKWPRPRRLASDSPVADDDLQITSVGWDEFSEDSDDFEEDPHEAEQKSTRAAPPRVEYWALAEDTVTSTKPARTVRAAFTREDDGSQIWFADGCLVVLKNRLEVESAPVTIAEYWPGLLKVGITRIDAVLSTPAMHKQQLLFVFRGYHCAQINDKNGDVVGGSLRKIGEAWPPLVKVGISTVDAILVYPAHDKFAFFSRNRYARIAFDFEKGSEGSVLIDHGAIKDRWPGVLFQSVDSVLVNAEDTTQVEFMSGDQVARTNIEPVGSDGISLSSNAARTAAPGRKEDSRAPQGALPEPRGSEGRSRGDVRGAARAEAEEAVEAVEAVEADDDEVIARGGSIGGHHYKSAITTSLVAHQWKALKSVGFY